MLSMELRNRTPTSPAGDAAGRVQSALLACADRLFGEQAAETGPHRRWLLRYLGVAMILAAIVVARRPDAVTNPQFWAEDGYVFFYENLTLGFPHALAKTYSGFPYLAQRLIAFAGGLVPFTLAPLIYSTSSIAITALGLATFCLPGFRHLVRNDGLRVMFAIAAVSAPFDQEVLSTLTNVSWFIGLWLSLLSVMRVPRRPWQVTSVALAGCAAIFSAPLAALNAPLWLLRAWRGVRRRDRTDLWFGVALLAGFVLLLVLAGSLGADWPAGVEQGARPSAVRTGAEVVWRYLLLMSYWSGALLLRGGPTGGGLTTTAGAFVLAGMFLYCLRGRAERALGIALALFFLAGSFVVLFLGRPALLLALPARELPSRYLVFPGAMLAVAVVAFLDDLPAGSIRNVGAVTAVCLLAWSWSPQFVIEPFVDLGWTEHAALLEQKVERKSLAQLVIPVNPAWGSPLEFDPVVLSTEIHVPPETILGALGTHGQFRQSFVCHCSPLRSVDMMLGAAAWSSKGSLTMSLIRWPAPEVVARTEIPRDWIVPEGTWQSFVFDPIRDSAGQRYTIVLKAVENEPEGTAFVLGAQGDPYPDGAAIFSTKLIEADATFRYGCLPPG
jgi:hypothetical protein